MHRLLSPLQSNGALTITLTGGGDVDVPVPLLLFFYIDFAFCVFTPARQLTSNSRTTTNTPVFRPPMLNHPPSLLPGEGCDGRPEERQEFGQFAPAEAVGA